MALERVTAIIDGAEVAAWTAGTGPALLLLHGFPQTHEAWRHVAPELARTHTVICPDLPGYGASAPPADPSKRRTAATVLELARRLGHDQTAVVGHDRGALVALRAALDHPETVTHLAVLDVLPALDLWESLHGTDGVFAFHLFLLAHPAPSAVRERYLAACGRPATIRAICDDYRASAGVDLDHERADRRAGRTVAAPTLALWQDPGDQALPFDPAAVWARWAPDLVTGTLATGHFLPEEAPDVVVDRLRRWLR